MYAPAEDLFLTIEGTGQYALYRWLTDPQGGGMAKPDALAFARRDGKRWSQDQGLALYLVLDRLWIDWPPATFGRGTADRARGAARGGGAGAEIAWAARPGACRVSLSPEAMFLYCGHPVASGPRWLIPMEKST